MGCGGASSSILSVSKMAATTTASTSSSSSSTNPSTISSTSTGHSRPRILSLLTPRLSTTSSKPQPRRSPLRPSAGGISIGACVRTGLLHNLRGAPSLDRNAIVVSPNGDVVMMAVYAGHGKYGARLAELAATVMSRVVRKRLSSAQTDCLEAVVDHAFVEANIAIDATPFCRSSGVSATLALVRKRVLVVGTCGAGCVMLASKSGKSLRLRRLHKTHAVSNAEECSRVERFGGVVVEGRVQGNSGALPVTRSMGELDMRSMGICQLPLIRTFDILARDAYVVLSTQPLWMGEGAVGPPVLGEVLGRGNCPVQSAENVMDVAFGAAGPLLDATIVTARLR